MIEVKNLVKKYGDRTAVSGISFTVEKGKIYGLLGPNGAGKSTTMNIMTGCLAATEGSVKINGFDIFENPKEAKKHIGYLPEIPPLYTDMTPEEYLTFVAEAKKVKKSLIPSQISEAMEMTGLTDVSDRLIRNLSKGYRQRVGIAQAMLGDPEIIILDEPTVGLDPKQILEIRELIKRLGETKTVIISSHILGEIRAVCDHIMIISRGNLVASGTIEELEKEAREDDALHLSVRGRSEVIKEALEKVDGVLSVKECGENAENGTASFKLVLTKEKDVRDDIFFAMSEIKCPIINMNFEEPSLEDIFLSLTSEEVCLDSEDPDEEAPEVAGEDSDSKDSDGDDNNYTPLFSNRD